jgi:hypothetical protein
MLTWTKTARWPRPRGPSGSKRGRPVPPMAELVDLARYPNIARYLVQHGEPPICPPSSTPPPFETARPTSQFAKWGASTAGAIFLIKDRLFRPAEPSKS